MAGLKFYGVRHDSDTVKGKGYFGELPTAEGKKATEISSYDEKRGDYPLLVPTLTKDEIEHLTSGKEPTDAIYDKAERWADTRRKQGSSPFAQPNELRVPTPKKKGGVVKAKPKSASKRADGIAQRGKTRGRVI